MWLLEVRLTALRSILSRSLILNSLRSSGKWIDEPFAYYSKADPETYIVHTQKTNIRRRASTYHVRKAKLNNNRLFIVGSRPLRGRRSHSSVRDGSTAVSHSSCSTVGLLATRNEQTLPPPLNFQFMQWQARYQERLGRRRHVRLRFHQLYRPTQNGKDLYLMAPTIDHTSGQGHC